MKQKKLLSSAYLPILVLVVLIILATTSFIAGLQKPAPPTSPGISPTIRLPISPLPTRLSNTSQDLSCTGSFSCPQGYKCFYGYDKPCPRGQDCSQITFNKIGDDKCHKLCQTDKDCPKGLRCVLKQAFKGDIETVYEKLCVEE